MFLSRVCRSAENERGKLPNCAKLHGIPAHRARPAVVGLHRDRYGLRANAAVPAHCDRQLCFNWRTIYLNFKTDRSTKEAQCSVGITFENAFFVVSIFLTLSRGDIERP